MLGTNESRIHSVIAERRLSVVGDLATVITVKIGSPSPDPSGDWRCPVEVEGIGDARQKDGRGVDALQSLLNAFEAARSVLDESGLVFCWEGGEPGDTGIPRFVPSFYGLSFARAIEAHIDHEIEAFAKAAEGRSASAPSPRA